MLLKDFIKVSFSLQGGWYILLFKKKKKTKTPTEHIICHVSIQGDLSIVDVSITLVCKSLNLNLSWAHPELKFSVSTCRCCHCYQYVFGLMSGNRICGNVAQFYLILDSSSLVKNWIFIHQLLQFEWLWNKAQG